ncbi:hypothetical protein, partial [Staphylococcus aureus]|uniref:hypothetical protein n=1 Tax=Staphylococcus aureus TaxID=1280 RepID=UPI00210EB3CA
KGEKLNFMKNSGYNSKCLNSRKKLRRIPTPIKIKVSHIFGKNSLITFAAMTPINITAMKLTADIKHLF